MKLHFLENTSVTCNDGTPAGYCILFSSDPWLFVFRTVEVSRNLACWKHSPNMPIGFSLSFSWNLGFIVIEISTLDYRITKRNMNTCVIQMSKTAAVSHGSFSANICGQAWHVHNEHSAWFLWAS
jgi:hypothetical protein